MRRQQGLIQDFTRGSIPGQLLTFAAPLFFSNLLQVAYNAADMVIVGQKLGESGLSAVSIGGDIAHFLTFFAMGFSNAAQILISQYVGAGKRDRVGRFVATAFSFLLSCALLISCACLLLRRPILRAMHTPDAAFEGALAYSTISALGLVFIYGYNVSSAVLRGMGDSRHPFLFVSVAAGMNIALDLLFVWGLNLGCSGAALATVLSQGLSFLLCLKFLHGRRRELVRDSAPKAFFAPDKAMCASLIKLGLPMAIKSASLQFSKLFVSSWINSYGVSVSAVAGIAGKLNSISNLMAKAFNTAGASMIGQNIGAKKYERVPKIMGSTLCITLCIAAVMSAVIMTFPKQVFGIFTSDPSVMKVALEYCPIAVLVFFGSACRAPANALINGSGNHRINFVTAILDGIIMRIGLSLLLGLGLGMGYMGFWLGKAIAGFTPMLIGVGFYLSGRWKKRSSIV